jgi:hypothetical protein
MTTDGEKLGELFHDTRREDHEDTLASLDTSLVGDGPATTREVRVDRADQAYALLHHAGKIDGPFEWPSVKAARLQREAMQENRPPEMRSFHWLSSRFAVSQEEIQMANDPAVILADEPDGTVAVREDFADNDALDARASVTWLRCKDLEDARRYVRQVGEDFGEPGPGEDDGKYWLRTIFVKQAPDQIQKVSPYGE